MHLYPFAISLWQFHFATYCFKLVIIIPFTLNFALHAQNNKIIKIARMTMK